MKVVYLRRAPAAKQNTHVVVDLQAFGVFLWWCQCTNICFMALMSEGQKLHYGRWGCFSGCSIRVTLHLQSFSFRQLSQETDKTACVFLELAILSDLTHSLMVRKQFFTVGKIMLATHFKCVWCTEQQFDHQALWAQISMRCTCQLLYIYIYIYISPKVWTHYNVFERSPLCSFIWSKIY